MHASRKQRLQQKDVGSATSLVIKQSHYVMQACKKKKRKEEKRKEKGKERRKEKGKGIEEL